MSNKQQFLKEVEMGRMLEFFTPLHKRTKRNYIERMMNKKVECMNKACEYEFDYWDGDRSCGYGGYKYDGRWKPVAQKLIDTYGIKDGFKILDVGCGKAHLLYEIKQLLPKVEVTGIDISRHGLSDAPEAVRPFLVRHRAQDPYPWGNQHFDLVISLGTLHNLHIYELETALKEIERVGKAKYIMVEGYRNKEELFNLECWALTAVSFYEPQAWIWLYRHFGYSGDYEFIYFE